MKNYKEKLRSERGSITSVVVVTVLFFITILSTAYMITATLRKSQLKSQIAIKDAYQKDVDNAEKIYYSVIQNVGQVSVGMKATQNSTINGEIATAMNPVIPEGYIAINTETSNWGDGTSSPTEENVNKGLVITDSVIEENGELKSNGNEWVWVPVPTPSDLYVTVTEPISITGGSGKTVVNDVSTSKHTKSEIISRITRGLPNTTSYREPDIVVGNNGASYDAIKVNWEAAGFSSIKDMAEKMVKDYDEMTKSIEKFKGFYIGRYELSNVGEKKNQPSLTNTNWYNLYAKCKELKASEKVETRMIWGLQWDATCNWIANYGDKKNITNSSKWGNYSNYNTEYSEGDEEYVSEAGNKQNTGYSEYWKANNIYDLAGNCYEWTQEACSSYNRAGRGR